MNENSDTIKTNEQSRSESLKTEGVKGIEFDEGVVRIAKILAFFGMFKNLKSGQSSAVVGDDMQKLIEQLKLVGLSGSADEGTYKTALVDLSESEPVLKTKLDYIAEKTISENTISRNTEFNDSCDSSILDLTPEPEPNIKYMGGSQTSENELEKVFSKLGNHLKRVEITRRSEDELDSGIDEDIRSVLELDLDGEMVKFPRIEKLLNKWKSKENTNVGSRSASGSITGRSASFKRVLIKTASKTIKLSFD